MNISVPHNRWLRTLLFYALHALAIYAVFIVVGDPIRQTLADRDQEILQRRAMLARMIAIGDKHAEVAKLSADFARDGAEFVANKSESILQAELQTRLKALIESAGGRPRAVRSLSHESTDGVAFVGAQVDFNGPLPAIHRALYAIEAAAPYLYIKGGVIRSSAATQAGKEPGLDAQLDVFIAVRAKGTQG